MIMQNDKVVSINNTTQIDLQGQASSESDGHRHISGTGGQLQFVRGAYASQGGKSFICLSSTYEKRGERRSRIVFNLTPGNIVTTPRSDVMYVVTEFGMANLKGKCVAERAKAIIALAHPDFREDLERQAYENRLIPRGVSFGCGGDESDVLHDCPGFFVKPSRFEKGFRDGCCLPQRLKPELGSGRKCTAEAVLHPYKCSTQYA